SVAQRICRDIASCRVNTERERLAITITMGVTQFREKDDVESVVERADKCMYTGKRRGKNQVVYE
ncbi:MAG: diguanylate cyclase, partial [Lachnospiraceae bacterium]|nr:diguanylate cyclase [Lachnospiraceae bacterium]